MLKKQIEDNLKKLSHGQVIAARFILQNPREAAFLTAAQIGKRVGVSESTVIRLAGALGYTGYPELRATVQQYLMEDLSTVERYRDYKKEHDPKDFLERVTDSAQATIALTKGKVDRTALSTISYEILAASSVFIFAQKSSYALAYYFSYYLSWFLPNTHLLESHLAYERIANTGKDTLAIGISFPRFTRWTTELLEFAHKEGVKTGAITSDFNSPLARVSDCVVSVPYNPVSFIDSFTAPLCVINAIIISVAHEMGEESSHKLANLERIWSERGIYTSGY
jgi:DNA-binding MurR/RpiR family transcriptional regulator